MTGGAVLTLLLTLQPAQLAPARMPQPQQVQQTGRIPVSAPQPGVMASEIMRSDARLADVCFVDQRYGWAVGDRGTIWHTGDGGRHWQLQRSGVVCPLESVFFLDRQTGFAAGGFTHPYTHSSTGVLLVTRDGGRRWHHNPKLLLPALKQVRFFNQQHGWAIGCSSAMYPSGAFVTDSGGRSWRPVTGGCPSPRRASLPPDGMPGWTAGDFLDPESGALAGRSGAVAMVQRGAIRPARTGSLGLRTLRQMKLVAPVHGWLIGDGGLVMMTGDLGASWQTPPGDLPQGMAEHFDFKALAVVGPQAWIAGSPGTCIFHSPDAGRTWRAFRSGQRLPIHALAFIDGQHGWAVGAMGTILATNDGGQTWRRQRSGFTRAALLGLFAEGRHVPPELFARLSGDEGYLGVVEVLGRRDVEVSQNDKVHPADRVHEALVAVGASDAYCAWRFPLRQAGLGLGPQRIIAGWDRANDGRGVQELEAHVVRQIRLWRPEVIVTHDADPRGDDPLGHLVNQVVLGAVEKAADPTSFVQQITHAGLEPWRVKKVYALLRRGLNGTTDLTTAGLATRLGRSLADLAAAPRGLLEDRFSVAPQTLGFRLLVDRLPREQGRRGFFSGIALQPGGEARRELLEPPPESIQSLRRIAQRRRNMQAILEQSGKDLQGGVQLLGQTGDLTRGLDPGSAGSVLYQLAQQYHRSGRWPLAAETFELLADRYPDHPLVRPALFWLLQYYAGGEAAWREQGKQRYTVRQASALSIDISKQQHRCDRAAALGRQIEQTRPDLFADPALRFPLAVAHRNQGFPRQAERFYLAKSRGAARDAWWACARGEQWLAKPEGLPPKPVLHCVAARAKPRLDGKLDEPLWQRARPANLQSAQHDDAQWPGAVMLAYDDEFLYLAINCRQAPGAEYQASKAPRPRDPDLSGHDRVDVFLDLDRDFATYYRLTVDHRGWPGEGCWGDQTWNPRWFVAAGTTGDTWTAEAAIPLDQLTGRYPASQHVWAIGIQRTVPGVGLQSWSTPASTAVRPEGFGYLIFD